MIPREPLSEVRMTGETSERNRSQADGCSVLPLTERQVQVLRVVEQWIASRGWPPSLAELCDALKMSSKAAVVEHLQALERKGFLRRDAGERRGLCVLVSSLRAVVLDPKPLTKSGALCERCRREIDDEKRGTGTR